MMRSANMEDEGVRVVCRASAGDMAMVGVAMVDMAMVGVAMVQIWQW